MAAYPAVTLQEVLSAIGGPLEEQSLWALLYQTSKSLEKAVQGKRMRKSIMIDYNVDDHLQMENSWSY